MRRIAVVLLLLVAVGTGFYAITRREQPTPPAAPPANPTNRQVEITHPVVNQNEIELHPTKTTIPETGDPVEHTLKALLATSEKGESAFPEGTRLLSLKVKDGLATIDLSDDFKMLGKKGDTSQSLAQNSLRKALAQFPAIQKMTVLVEGKLFEDAHSGEWEEIPVRDASASAEAQP